MVPDDNSRAMMYWSSLFQKNPSKELNEKINEEMIEQQVNQMRKDEPENPLSQDSNLDSKENLSQTLSHEEKALAGQLDSTKKDLDEALKTTRLLKDVFSPSRKHKVEASDFSNWKHSKERLIQHLQDMDTDELGDNLGGDTLLGKFGGTGSSIGYEMASHEVEAVMNDIETKLVNKMDLTTLLSDDDLASTITPQMSMVETLLMQKGRLSGKALLNAKRLIRRYIRKLTEEFKPRVERSVIKTRDPSVVPKRTFRNLDMKRTIWDNLPNWDDEEKKLIVSKLRFHRASNKRLPSKLIIVVDQSGSMIPAMVQSTILASIFAGLPDVDVNLFAFDTRVMNLTKYVSDPFEVLLQTKLGGGTHINLACNEAKKLISDPDRTGFILITDYYEGGSTDQLFRNIKDIKVGGSTFVSVGPMNSSGRHAYINPRFVKRLEQIGIDTIIGGVDDLIDQIAEIIR